MQLQLTKSKYLSDLFYKVDLAFDGVVGLAKAEANTYDLVILDIMLPGMDGYKVSRLLKFDERVKNIPIIMLTAKALDEDKALGEQTGADHYMTKPFSMGKLVAKIQEFLGE